jgi:hypothetical protein
MTKAALQFQRRERFHRVHTLSALIVAAWLLLLALTGVAINHQESLGLADLQVSDQLLPSYYRAEFRTGSTSALVILTDIHSGRIFGPFGTYLTDAIALLIVVSVISGLASYQLKKQALRLARTASANGDIPPAR